VHSFRHSSQLFSFSTATPVISANENSNGVLWILDNSSYSSSCCQVLYAFNAIDLGKMLYNSNQAAGGRDVPGGAVKFSVPTVANGKVYVGGQSSLSAFGLIATLPTAAPPAFSPAPGTYNGNTSVALSDSTSGSTIYFTTNGAAPTTSSTRYSSPIRVNTTETLKALATATGYQNSSIATGVFTIQKGKKK
jgi:hypothetical protein